MNTLLIDEAMQTRDHLATFCKMTSAFASGQHVLALPPERFAAYMSLQRYEFSNHDMECYLLSKQLDEVIGLSRDSLKCFLIEALHSKYPEVGTVYIDLDPLPVFVILGAARVSRMLPLSREMLQAVNVFDEITDTGQPVTKRQFYDAWLSHPKPRWRAR